MRGPVYDTVSIYLALTVYILCSSRCFLRHTRAEQKEGQTRPINRTYYFIDYQATIDAIKWRVYVMNKNVQGNTIPEAERKEYFCRRCKSEWTTIEVLDKWHPTQGFLCHKCNFVLEHDPNNNRGGHEQSTKYHAQFKFITDMLPKLDEVIIPDCTFDKALAVAVPVTRDETNPANITAPVDAAALKPTAVKGMANTGPTSIAVTLTASDGPTEADIAADQARKEKAAAQNVLPVHFTHSTISGEQVKFDPNAQPGHHPTGFPNADKKPTLVTSSGDGADIDDYFARLKAETAKERELEQAEEYETDDDEDDDGFEDVMPDGTGSAAATPASSSGEAKHVAGNDLAGVLKKRKSGSVSGSGTSTGVTSPVTGPNTPTEDGRAAKKVRIEEPIPKVEEESEEEEEFEDV